MKRGCLFALETGTIAATSGRNLTSCRGVVGYPPTQLNTHQPTNVLPLRSPLRSGGVCGYGVCGVWCCGVRCGERAAPSPSPLGCVLCGVRDVRRGRRVD